MNLADIVIDSVRVVFHLKQFAPEKYIYDPHDFWVSIQLSNLQGEHPQSFPFDLPEHADEFLIFHFL